MANKLGVPKGIKCIGFKHPNGYYTIIDYKVEKKLGRIRIHCHVNGKGCKGEKADWQRKSDFDSGKISSCGCIRRQQLSDRSLEHGDSLPNSKYAPLYRSWKNMKTRCKPSFVQAADYFHKGIRVCAEWENDYQAFKDWACKNGWESGLSLDRIDNNKGYDPENCRWVTQSDQAKNTSRVLKFTYDGETKNLTEWSKDPRCNVSYETLLARLSISSWPFAKALTTPPRSAKVKSTKRRKLRNIYWAIRDRCYNQSSISFANYGGRGIQLCAEWMSSIDAFLDWAIERYIDGYELDRIDNSRGYSPENCRFVSRQVNIKNRRNTVMLAFGGKVATPAEWALMPEAGEGVGAEQIRQRKRKGYTDEEAITLALGQRRS